MIQWCTAFISSQLPKFETLRACPNCIHPYSLLTVSTGILSHFNWQCTKYDFRFKKGHKDLEKSQGREDRKWDSMSHQHIDEYSL